MQTPAVIECPNFKQIPGRYSMFIDNYYLLEDKYGYTECTLMIPRKYIGVLIGYKGHNIKRMMKTHNVHVQTKQEENVFIDKSSYNIPVMWTNPMPCFIIFGKADNIRNIIKEFIYILDNTKHIRDKKLPIFRDTIDIYRDNHTKRCNSRYDEIMAFNKDELLQDIYNECNKYLSDDEAEISSKFIVNSYEQDIIATLFLNYNDFITLINYIKFLIDTGEEITQDNIVKIDEYESDLEKFTDSLREERSEVLNSKDLQDLLKYKGEYSKILEPVDTKQSEFEFTEDELREGDIFIFENQLSHI